MSRQIHLMGIDFQNSFCQMVDPTEQQSKHNGELCVPGALEDAKRVANLIKRLGSKIDDIHMTLDSHHLLHVAHPMWFKNSSGQRPDPFTIMRVENGVIIGSAFDANGTPHDVGEFTTARPSFLRRTIKYIEELAINNRYPHCIWPPHCLIGTPGHNLVPEVADVLLEWCEKEVAFVNFVTKGSNIFCEHFSALRAEVPDSDDPTTQINTNFINAVMEADEVVLCGEAGSHCLANTVRDMANEFATTDEFIKKCVLLTDGTSPVPGFEQYQIDFVNEMTARGMKSVTCADYLA